MDNTAGSGDGVDEAMEGLVRVAMTAALQVAQQVARARENALRRAQAQSAQEAREVRARYEAERRVTGFQLAAVTRPEWWDKATPEMIGSAYRTAYAWSADDLNADWVKRRIETEVKDRFGVELDAAGGAGALDPQVLSAAVRAHEQLAEEGRIRAEAARVGAAAQGVEAQTLMATATLDEQRADQQTDQQSEQQAEQARSAALYEPDPDERAAALEQVAAASAANERAVLARVAGVAAYDSRERRAETAAQLEAKGIAPDVVAARMLADVSQAKPATEAVTAAVTDKALETSQTSRRALGLQVTQRGRDGGERGR
ncbi:hypothetical protein [Nocardioides alkalitolerans]|uniref:hypothetical protein n=1 Tax=Nocardioides alkalitolerans TaxID=281714 RepID=UPI000416ADAC|nr:hypothetical protein [Nocardioides alkalitolerans]